MILNTSGETIFLYLLQFWLLCTTVPRIGTGVTVTNGQHSPLSEMLTTGRTMAALYSIQEQWRVTVTNNTNLIQTERRTTRETDLKIQVKTEDTFFSSG